MSLASLLPPLTQCFFAPHLWPLWRRALFLMEPERAHEVILGSLEHVPSGLLAPLLQSAPTDPVTLAGVTFRNRIGLAAGLDKDARALDAFAALGFGFIEAGTVTPKPQSGNPPPRLFRLESAEALINRMGFNNGGLDAFMARVQRAKLRAAGVALGINLGKNASTPLDQAAADYRAGIALASAEADYLTINISSPNTQGLRQLQSAETLRFLLQECAAQRDESAQEHGRRPPLFVKLAPDLNEEEIAAICAVLGDGLADGIVATNTTLSRDGVQTLPHGQESGGLSGAPLLKRSNAVIQQLRTALGAGFPIIGAGGVMSAEDALSKVAAGADAVQIYTGLIYRGPAIVRAAALALKQHGERY